jgi:tRNA(fMet)-specific endonuclease VapC
MADPLFLLDTNILLYVLEGRSEEVRARVEARLPGELVTSAVVAAELLVGTRKLGQLEKARHLLRVIPAVPFDQSAAEIYAVLPFRRGSYDRLIAAQALASGLTLVTNNERNFAEIAGLRVENWTR